MTKPIIGLSTSLVRAKWSVWDTEATLLDSRYVNAVVRAGAIPVLLPANDGDPEAVLLDLMV